MDRTAYSDMGTATCGKIKPYVTESDINNLKRCRPTRGRLIPPQRGPAVCRIHWVELHISITGPQQGCPAFTKAPVFLSSGPARTPRCKTKKKGMKFRIFELGVEIKKPELPFH